MAVERTHLSIGEVLTLLQPEYPDITISKIRFLESQGLLDPERTPSGYRKFHDPDIERLRWILTQQRDHFLPLKVIKDRLNSGDLTGDGDGVLPLGGDTPSRPTASSTGPNRSRANRDADVDAGTSDDGDPAAFDGGAAQGAGDDRDDHGDATEVDGSTAARADDDSTAPPSTASEPAEGPDASGAETTPTTGSDARREAGATPEPSVAGSEQGNGVDGDPASADGGEDPGPGDGDVAPSEAEQASSRRALTLLKRAGVVPPDATAAASSHDRNDPDDHDRARNVARLVEAPAEASPDPATRGRRRHPTGHTPGEPVPPPEPDETDRPEPLEPASSVSLSLEELSTASGLSPRELGELERYGLLSNRTLGTVRYYDDEALVVARLAAGFGRYGIEPRHLRMYKVAAEREAGLFEQLITPLLKQRRASARQEAVEVLEELAELADDLRAAMVRSALRDYLGRS